MRLQVVHKINREANLSFGTRLSLSAGKAKRLALTAAAAKALPHLLVLIALALRLYRIDHQSLWYDEGWSIHLATRSISEALPLIASPGHTHPPLYYLLLHYWGILAGFSELSLRFLSLLFGMLLVPVSYRLARRLYDAKTGLVVIAIAAFAPLYVTYSQETRMYSLLTLECSALLYLFYRLTSAAENPSWREWAMLILLEASSIYTHYSSFLIIAYLSALAIALLWRQRRSSDLCRWLGVQAMVALSYLPWAQVAIQRMATHTTQTAEPPGLISFAGQVWHFYNAGTIAVISSHALFTTLSSLSAIALAVALLILWRNDRKWGQGAMLLLHTMVPFFLVLLISRVRPGIHPRYVIMLSVPLFILIGRAIDISTKSKGCSRLIGVVLGLMLLLTSAAGLHILYFETQYHKDNVRSLAEYLESTASGDDLIIFDYRDYAFSYYYHGAAPVRYFEIDGNEPQISVRLRECAEGKKRVFLAKWYQGETDERGVIRFLLELNGWLADEREFQGFDLKTYELKHAVSLPKLQSIFADYGLLQLTGAFYETAVPVDEAVCLALRWRLAGQAERGYKAVVALRDGRGRQIASANVPLLDRDSRPTDRWPAGTETINYYVIPLPTGTAPLSYTLAVGVYDESDLAGLDLLDEARAPAGKHFLLGTVNLTKARTFASGPCPGFEPVGLPLADGLVLEGFTLDRREVRAGEELGVALCWRAMRDGLPSYVPELRLVQEGTVIAAASGVPLDGRYPSDLWSEGELVIDRRDLVLSPEAKEGPAVLELALGAGLALKLPEIGVEAAERLFVAPPMQHELEVAFGDFAELIGYDLDRPVVSPKEGVKLTVYWRAINREPLNTSYTVFTHILNREARLIAQHDGIPAGGGRPTTGWMEGEIIVDLHEMEFSDLTCVGTGIIEVGLYDARTMERVLTSEGSDHLLLPSEIIIKP